MKAKMVIKIAAEVVFIIDGAITLIDMIKRRKRLKEFQKEYETQTENERLFRIFEELKAECNKSSESATKAIKMMDELMEQIDNENGIDPTTINVEFVEANPIS